MKNKIQQTKRSAPLFLANTPKICSDKLLGLMRSRIGTVDKAREQINFKEPASLSKAVAKKTAKQAIVDTVKTVNFGRTCDSKLKPGVMAIEVKNATKGNTSSRG